MRKDSGQTLVATMVVLVIICVLAGVYFVGGSGTSTKGSRPDGNGKTLVGRAIYRARDEVCRSDLNQLRQSIQINSTEDSFPASLEDTKLGPDFYRCPIGKEPYEYNPQTGEVKCKHPGHEKY